jgi:predicted MPP superfamily phosphohydrolase
VSDLHFGRQFQGSKWLQLRECAKSLAPDLLIITGDLVYTPWFWMLKRARVELNRLEIWRRPSAFGRF